MVEAAVQAATELGGPLIKEKFGWRGCAVALAAVVIVIGIAWWRFTR
jgi:hypothetical protein